jgi:putative ABC transport system permease protein
MGSRLSRWAGLIAVGWQRVHHRLSHGGGRQTLVSVLGIALPVAVLLLVASVSLGLAAHPSAGDEADYWVVPEGTSSTVTNVESAQLGSVHRTAARLTERDDIAHASPMLIDFIQLETPGGERVYVLAIGVIPSAEYDDIAPLSTEGLQPGDPYYADGGYNGTWTGEAIISESAATELGADPGAEINTSGTTHSFTTTAVRTPGRAGLTQLPILVAHLSELQAITGAQQQDSASQLVVVADQPSAGTEQVLAGLYPKTTVQTRGGLLSQQGTDSRLPTAMALAALIISMTTGVLLVSTAFGFELAADSKGRQLMSALGIAARSRAGIIGTELGVVSLYGGSLGVGIWGIGALAVNQVTMARFGAPVATLNLRFVAYGIGVAMLIGLLSLPYLLVIDWRSRGEVTLR